MTYPFQRRMSEILELTRAGRLSEATNLIRGLGGSDSAPASTPDMPIDIRANVPPALPATPPPAPERRASVPPADNRGVAKFDKHRFASRRESHDYYLYEPPQVRAGMPLVVMLHGCTQSAMDFARGTRMNELAEEIGFLVVYPEQSKAANAQKCWNWFRPQDQAKGTGEPGLIAGIVRQVIADTGADSRRVYIAGLSAGGAAAAIMADAYPDIFAAVGIHSGLACGAASDLPGALAAMRGKGRSISKANTPFVPLITFHGDRDATVHPANSDQIHAAWNSQMLPNLVRRSDEGTSRGGRRYLKTSLNDTDGRSLSEDWRIAGAGHAWSGGSSQGSFTDASGPDASREMIRFFFQHTLSVV